MMPREKWTDERLDGLQAEMRQGFTRVEGEIKRLDGDVRRLDGNLEELRREINARFDSVNRNVQAVLVAVLVALIGTNAF